MYLVQGFERAITQKLRTEDEMQQATRTPSGKLSASMLGEPLQWQVLKSLGVGQRVVDDYVLRKFARGRDTEEWYLNQLEPCVKNRQALVTYRGAIGFYDALVDTAVYKGKFGVIPLEIKSVTNAKFKNIINRRQPDEHHLLQGAFYALGLDNPNFGLSYIASDDYRTITWIFEAKDYKEKIDGIIDRYEAAMAAKTVPVFEAVYPWQKKLEYNKFPEWMDLDQKAINLALKAYHPDAWEKYEAKKKGAA